MPNNMVKAKFEAKFSDQGSGLAQKMPKAMMPEKEKEEPAEADVDAWCFLEPTRASEVRALARVSHDGMKFEP
jgi:hypothetical protein